MSWRSLQLKQKACAQDDVIFDLFKQKTVNYLGQDPEFASRLKIDKQSQHLIAVLNYRMWLSELIDNTMRILVTGRYETFYLSVNRYQIIGNDTDMLFDRATASGLHIINLLTSIAHKQSYKVIKTDYFDNDLGRHMNWVQPVTWIYGTSTPDI